MSYLSTGIPHQIGSVTARDSFTGNGTKTYFALSQEVPASDGNSVFVFVNNTIKKSSSDYTLVDGYVVTHGSISGTFTLDETVNIGSTGVGKLIQITPSFVVLLTSGTMSNSLISGVSSSATTTITDFSNREGINLHFTSAPINTADIFVIHNTKLYYRRPPNVIISETTPLNQDVGTVWWKSSLHILSIYEPNGMGGYQWSPVTSSNLDAGAYPIVGSPGPKYQHLRNSTSGIKPGSSDLNQGEISINLTDKKLYTKTITNTIIPVGIHPTIGPTAISSPDPGDLWFDTSTSLFKIWSGSTWNQSGNFLPLSGGTLTGTLTAPKIVLTDNTKSISTNTASNFLSLYGGIGSSADAYFILKGPSAGSNPSGFELGANGNTAILSDVNRNITVTSATFNLNISSNNAYNVDASRNHSLKGGSVKISPAASDSTSALFVINNSSTSTVTKTNTLTLQGTTSLSSIVDTIYLTSKSTDANWSSSTLEIYTRQSNSLVLQGQINSLGAFLLGTSSAYDTNKLNVNGAITSFRDNPTGYTSSHLQLRSSAGDVSLGFNADSSSAAELLHPRGSNGRLRLYNSTRSSFGDLEVKSIESDLLTLQGTYSSTSGTSGTQSVNFSTKQIWGAGTLTGTITFNITYPSKAARGLTLFYNNPGYSTIWSGITWRNGEPPQSVAGWYTVTLCYIPGVIVFGSWLRHN